jgi:type VI protein secretion system component Hcp
MAKGEDGNILMKMQTKNGHWVSGETTTRLDPPGSKRSALLKDFQQGSMFELDSFTFSVNIDDNTGWENGVAPAANEKLQGTQREPPKPRSFAAFRAGKKANYPVSVQPVEIKRSVDFTSTLLLQHCVDCMTFKRVALVKSKPAGSASAGEAYLRIDFEGVLLIDASWTNDEPVQSTFKFIARKVLIQYRPQLPDGTLGAVVPGRWKANPTEADIQA